MAFAVTFSPLNLRIALLYVIEASSPDSLCRFWSNPECLIMHHKATHNHQFDSLRIRRYGVEKGPTQPTCQHNPLSSPHACTFCAEFWVFLSVVSKGACRLACAGLSLSAPAELSAPRASRPIDGSRASSLSSDRRTAPLLERWRSSLEKIRSEYAPAPSPVA